MCPKCKGKYQLNRGLIGQKIRCPNPECREVFEVAEAASPKPKTAKQPSTRTDRRAPQIDSEPEDIRSSKAAAPEVRSTKTAAPAVPKEADWSQLPPPPVRKTERAQIPVAEEAPRVMNEPATSDEVLAWMQQMPGSEPAVANPSGEDLATQGVEELPSAEDYEPTYDFAPPPRKRRWIMWGIIGCIAILSFSFWLTIYYRGKGRAKFEADMLAEAQRDLDQGRLRDAKQKYETLLKNFPDSKEREKYRFVTQYLEAHQAATNVNDPPLTRKNKFDEYVTKIRIDTNEKAREWLNERRGDTWQTGVKLATEHLDLAQKAADAKDYAAAAALLRDMPNLEKFITDNAPPQTQLPIPESITKREADLAARIEAEENLAEFIKKAEEALKTPTLVKVAEIETESKKRDYANNATIKSLLDQAKKLLRDQIKFVQDPQDASQPLKSDLQSLIVAPAPSIAPKAADSDRVVFALARGVLSALSESNGQILWTSRVGIDTSTLPLRVPALGKTHPELVLVSAPDGRGLIAREALTGAARWYATLPAPCRGSPILVERRAYMPLADDKGTVAVLETFNGQRLGYIPMGQKLGPGGVLQEGTSRLFLPADSQNVFVLDTNPPNAGPNNPPVELQAILVTGHGSGTLRSEPLVIGGTDEGGQATPGYLVLCQNDGINGMRLRTFRLGLPSEQMVALSEVRLNGWSWFAPVGNQEKMAIVSDTGTFALFGLNTMSDQEGALFPQLKLEPNAATGRIAGRGQVVYAGEHEFWYLANGELNMLRSGFDPKEGLKVAPGWKQPLTLGTPLHAAQVSGDGSLLIVVTQTSNPPACLATAVEADSGLIRWQRNLGLVVQGDPLLLGGTVLQMDQNGGVYQIDPNQDELKSKPNQEWYRGGQVLVPPRAGVAGETVLLPAADGKSAYAIVPTENGTKLLVKQIVVGQGAKDLPAVNLGAPLAGPPVLSGTTLIVPRANGSLYRQKLGSDKGESGPDWGSITGASDTRVFVLPMDGDDLLVTDGLRGISKFSWPAGGTFQKKQEQRMAGRTVAPLLALPAEKGPPQVVVADSTGQISLLDSESLQTVLSWKRLGNEITGGPFLIGGKGQPTRIFAIVDRATLVCLAPDLPQPAWKYRAKGDAIASRPYLSGNTLIVADLAGRYDTLDLQTGTATGQTFPMTGVLPAAPACAPVDLGDGRLFAPLSDGTVLLIPEGK
jgi:outer membrane protein assembly factor BamB